MSKREHNLATTYIKGYNISTGYRQSSATITDPPSWYYETLVFEWDGKERGKIVDMASDSDSPAMHVHCRMIQKWGLEREEPKP